MRSPTDATAHPPLADPVHPGRAAVGWLWRHRPDDSADTTLAPVTTTAATTTITMPSTTTASPTTTVSSSDSSVTVTKDIVYLEMNGHEYLVDVYVPAGHGPWPVVVALHGATVYKNNSILTVIAKAAAEAGMLVFAPNWVAQWPALSAEFVRSEGPVLPCALAFAQQEAARYGGDPARTVVYGHSGGPRPERCLCLDQRAI